MPLLFGDFTFFMLIPALIFALWAQGKVKSTYKEYSKIRAASGRTGAEVARNILLQHGVNDVDIETVRGSLTDHYDPAEKKLRLSEGIYDGASIAAIGIAAHETGHALQHADGYAPLSLRTSIYPIATIGSNLAFPLFFIGLFFTGSKFMMDLGIYMYLAALAFTVITLPVEFNASRRAVELITQTGALRGEEVAGAKKVLDAAALTYVAATAMAVMQLLRMLILRGSRD